MAKKQTAKKTETLAAVPAEWPGAFGLYTYSKEAVMVNVGPIIIVNLLGFVIEIGLRLALKQTGQLLGYLVAPVASIITVVLYLYGIRRERLETSDAIKQSTPLWLRSIGLSFLVGIVSILSILALIIPAIFVIPRLALAKYFLADQDMGIMDAFQASWNSTKGYVGHIWAIIGVNVLYVLLCITLIGIPFAIYLLIMYGGATALVYEMVKKSAVPAKAAKQ